MKRWRQVSPYYMKSSSPVAPHSSSMTRIIRPSVRRKLRIRRRLKRDYLNRYFLKNTLKLLPTFLVSIAMVVVVAVLGAFTPMAVVVFVLTFAVHALFIGLMRAPTQRGRQLMDKLEGFKLYLEVAEKDDLNLRNPPDLTPALFERYLPFAIALGVEQEWAEQFAACLRGWPPNRVLPIDRLVSRQLSIRIAW